MEGFSVLTHKGKSIYYIDYTNVGKSKEKTLALLKYATEEYQKNDTPDSVLAIVNLTSIQYDMDLLKCFKEEGAKTALYEKKVAVIGITGLIRAGYNFVAGLTNSKMKVKDSMEEALEWVASD